jgi:O-6-methylguanine DNA methyltransferase
MNTCKYDIVLTPLGDLTIIFTDKGIRRIEIGAQNSDYLKMTQMAINSGKPAKAFVIIDRQELLADWKQQLESYLQGIPVNFNIPLDIREGTAFKKKVWRVLQRIPYGETRSYRWVAQQTGNACASRAVGQANAANPIPIIIPCHRVIRSDGSLGGFSSGINIKKELLRLETVFSPSPDCSG